MMRLCKLMCRLFGHKWRIGFCDRCLQKIDLPYQNIVQY